MVDTEEVRRLLAEGDKKKLDKLASDIRFGGKSLEGENGVDRDDALGRLSCYGATSFYEDRYG
ncbi:MAG: hypothetical protein AABW80_01135 [Nanoarchaeota archaeon]